MQTQPDFYQISSLTAVHKELLLAAGVISAADLAKNHPLKLLRWMEEVNQEQRIVRKMPSLDAVSEWVEKAKSVAA